MEDQALCFFCLSREIAILAWIISREPPCSSRVLNIFNSRGNQNIVLHQICYLPRDSCCFLTRSQATLFRLFGSWLWRINCYDWFLIFFSFYSPIESNFQQWLELLWDFALLCLKNGFSGLVYFKLLFSPEIWKHHNKGNFGYKMCINKLS